MVEFYVLFAPVLFNALPAPYSRHSKSRLRWWHHVKDPVTTPPANHKDGMDIEQPAQNSLHHRWNGTNHVSYLKNLFAGTHHIRRHLANRPAVSFCFENHYHLSKVFHDFRYPVVCNLSIPFHPMNFLDLNYNPRCKRFTGLGGGNNMASKRGLANQ